MGVQGDQPKGEYGYFESEEDIPEGWTKGGYGKPEKYKTLEQHLSSGEALAIYEKDIKPEERRGSLPSQGYVWVEE